MTNFDPSKLPLSTRRVFERYAMREEDLTELMLNIAIDAVNLLDGPHSDKRQALQILLEFIRQTTQKEGEADNE